jgi:hypothetical protein
MIGSNCDESPKGVKTTRFTNLETIVLFASKDTANKMDKKYAQDKSLACGFVWQHD